MGNYYVHKHGIDFRSIRYPGVISPTEYESHGTTDYASEIFFSAIRGKDYKVCLSADTVLPMAYLDDILEGTLKLITADEKPFSTRIYNIHGLSFSCEELVKEIKKFYPKFECKYEPDFRDEIAKTWPEDLDDQLARKDWGWNPKCKNVQTLVETMIKEIKTTIKI